MKLIIAVLVLNISLVWANDSLKPKPLDGCYVNVKETQQVYDLPPHGLLNLLVDRQEGCAVEVSERVRILETKYYGSFKGYLAWYLVVNESGTKQGWIKGGSITDMNNSNLKDLDCSKQFAQ